MIEPDLERLNEVSPRSQLRQFERPSSSSRLLRTPIGCRSTQMIIWAALVYPSAPEKRERNFGCSTWLPEPLRTQQAAMANLSLRYQPREPLAMPDQNRFHRADQRVFPSSTKWRRAARQSSAFSRHLASCFAAHSSATASSLVRIARWPYSWTRKNREAPGR